MENHCWRGETERKREALQQGSSVGAPPREGRGNSHFVVLGYVDRHAILFMTLIRYIACSEHVYVCLRRGLLLVVWRGKTGGGWRGAWHSYGGHRGLLKLTLTLDHQSFGVIITTWSSSAERSIQEGRMFSSCVARCFPMFKMVA